jgi:hypothetical protein
VSLDDQFVIVMDPSNGFWFLPGGGAAQSESIEDAANREAFEELGVEIKINQITETFHVTLISRETGEQLQINPFIVVDATYVGGQFKTEYAPKRKIFLFKKDKCDSLLQDKIPEEYECMRPYLCISKEIIRGFLRH